MRYVFLLMMLTSVFALVGTSMNVDKGRPVIHWLMGYGTGILNMIIFISYT